MMPRASDVLLGGFVGPVYDRSRCRFPLDNGDGVFGTSLAGVTLRPPDQVPTRPEACAIAIGVASDSEVSQFGLLLLAEFPLAPAVTGLLASGSTESSLRTGPDDLRPGWEDHAAPYRWAWFSFLLTGGPGRYLDRPASRGQRDLPGSLKRQGGERAFDRPGAVLRKREERRAEGRRKQAERPADRSATSKVGWNRLNHAGLRLTANRLQTGESG